MCTFVTYLYRVQLYCNVRPVGPHGTLVSHLSAPPDQPTSRLLLPTMSAQVQVGLRVFSEASVSARLRVCISDDRPTVKSGNAVLLDALDEPELLSLIAGHLAASDQCSLSSTCKLLALIIGENQQELSFMHSAVTTSVEETRTLVMPQLKAPPTFGLVFANPGRQRTQKLISLVRSLPPAIHLVGGEVETLVGTTPTGEIFSSHDQGFALSLGAFPEASVNSFVLAHEDGQRTTDAYLAQLTAQGAFHPGVKVIIVLSLEGRRRELSAVLRALQTHHKSAAIIGGLATGRYLLRAHAHRVQVVRHGIVGLAFGGNVPMHAVVCPGSARVDQRLQRAKQQLVDVEGKELLGALMFTCLARSCVNDAKNFAKTFPTGPLVGMPCGGEIGPSGGSGEVALQGFTAVYGLFAVPVRERRPLSLQYADLEAAYAERRATPAALLAAKAAAAAQALAAEEDGDEDVERQDGDMDIEDDYAEYLEDHREEEGEDSSEDSDDYDDDDELVLEGEEMDGFDEDEFEEDAQTFFDQPDDLANLS